MCACVRYLVSCCSVLWRYAVCVLLYPFQLSNSTLLELVAERDFTNGTAILSVDCTHSNLAADITQQTLSVAIDFVPGCLLVIYPTLLTLQQQL